MTAILPTSPYLLARTGIRLVRRGGTRLSSAAGSVPTVCRIVRYRQVTAIAHPTVIMNIDTGAHCVHPAAMLVTACFMELRP